jgi:hypothetical protein
MNFTEEPAESRAASSDAHSAKRRRRVTWLVVDAFGVAALAIIVATGILWARSMQNSDVLGYEGAESGDGWDRGGYVSSARGAIALQWWRREVDAERPSTTRGWGYTSREVVDRAMPPGWRWYAVGYDAQTLDFAHIGSTGAPVPPRWAHSKTVRAPHFAVMLLVLPAVVIWLRRFTVQRLMLSTSIVAILMGLARYSGMI